MIINDNTNFKFIKIVLFALKSRLQYFNNKSVRYKELPSDSNAHTLVPVKFHSYITLLL